MKKLFPKPRRKRKPRAVQPLRTNRDPGYRGLKHLKAIQNSEGWYRP